MESLTEILKEKKWKKMIFLLLNSKEIDFVKKTLKVEISYKKSKFLNNKDISFELLNKNNSLLSNFFEFNFQLKGSKHFLEISLDDEYLLLKLDETDDNLSTFYNFLYDYIIFFTLNLRVSKEEFVDFFLISLFIPRGSFDFSANFFSVDLYRESTNENFYKNLLKLIVSNFSLDEIKKFNINFRELQKDYIDGKRRNTQFRIDLKWFLKKYANFLKIINLYKFEIYEQNIDIIKKLPEKKDSFDFIVRLKKYIEIIIGHSFKNDSNLEHLKKEIFGINDESQYAPSRNQSIVAIAKLLLENKCYSCCDEYDISTRSFKYRDRQSFYLEIHHVLPFANYDLEVDNIDNLVKLCPVCHAALKKNRAEISFQKKIINSILKNRETSSKFIEMFLDDKNINSKIDYIYERLT